MSLQLIEDTGGTMGACRYQGTCSECGWMWPMGGWVRYETVESVYRDHDCTPVVPKICNCTENWEPYCGRPECDIDWCRDCGDEYSEPCARHTGVDHV